MPGGLAPLKKDNTLLSFSAAWGCRGGCYALFGDFLCFCADFRVFGGSYGTFGHFEVILLIL